MTATTTQRSLVLLQVRPSPYLHALLSPADALARPQTRRRASRTSRPTSAAQVGADLLPPAPPRCLRRPAEKKKPKKKSKKAAVKQTEPPTVPVSRFFKDGTYPVGELHDYVGKCVAFFL